MYGIMIIYDSDSNINHNNNDNSNKNEINVDCMIVIMIVIIIIVWFGVFIDKRQRVLPPKDLTFNWENNNSSGPHRGPIGF